MHLCSLLPLLTLMVAATAQREELAALLVPRDKSTVITGKYIVKLKDDVSASGLSAVVGSLSSKAEHVYEKVFKGFATKLDEAGLKVLRKNPHVDYIEPDQEASASAIVRQIGSPWGLTRISHARPTRPEYVYDDSAGAGVCAYVIDSGVDRHHPEFENRADQIISFVPGSQVDDNGHGTHVAGTIGSRTYGVAKKVTIFGVKVLRADGKGDWSAILAGMDFVIRDTPTSCPNGAVVNLSLGSPFLRTGNEAAARLVRAGFFVGVAAGNDNKDAKNYSPASEPSVCTVGGTARFDTRYNMSNWGPALDILGPGVEIESTLPNNRTGVLTGTSMATPHITGLAAYLASLHRQRAGPGLCQMMQKMATRNAITDQIPGTVNLLAFNGAT